MTQIPAISERKSFGLEIHVEDGKARQIRRETFWRNNQPSIMTALDRADVDRATTYERINEDLLQRIILVKKGKRFVLSIASAEAEIVLRGAFLSLVFSLTMFFGLFIFLAAFDVGKP